MIKGEGGMREIKFRAWDKENKKMLRDFHDGCIPSHGVNITILRCQEFLEVMQFTGLKDKNGVDIFEGDLLQFGDDEDAHYEVFYNDDLAKFDNCRVHYHGTRCGGSIPPIYSCCLKVIGNIWENKELIK